MSVRLDQLSNGMRVVSQNMPHVETVSLGVWVKAGSRTEDEHEHGISHFLEHMAFKGTQRRNALQIAEA
ncbi:MAG: M16 family metallopeptidase, partial [Methyloligellaceae bacterium]